jgi:tetratricopeptide (TPR) repeat protein
MIDEPSGDDTAEPDVNISSSAAAPALSIFQGNGTSEEAREYLRRQSNLSDKQSRFLDLQMESLHEQRQLHISHLKWRRFNDQMSGALQIMLVIVGALVLAGLGAWLWSAAHDNGLAIEAFSVPPDLAARGLTGQTVASRLLDDLSAMQAETDSVRPPSSYSNNWGDDIKVQIPETGVSVGELNRYLRAWLGNETRITGEVYISPAGLAVTARAGSDAAPTFEGPEHELDRLLQKAAEQIYARTQPYRYAMYLEEHGKMDDAIAILAKLAASASRSERAWAYIGWSIALSDQGRIVESAERARDAIRADPAKYSGWGNLLDADLFLDHPEEALATARTSLVILHDREDADMAPDAAALSASITEANVDEFVGDFRAAAREDEAGTRLPDFRHQGEYLAATEAQDWALDHDGAAAREVLGRVPRFDDPYDIANLRTNIALMNVGLEDWAQALAANETAVATWRGLTGAANGGARVFVVRIPTAYLALTKAMTGDLVGARAAIAGTPADCYTCIRMRGKIDALAKNWGAAGWWFAVAIRQAPSLPFAYSDWGQMLLGKGDLEGAIGKFRQANAKGPHFADPLELWGEALMAQRRSDLALSKFAEADKFAPNWGRLHLKWGDALLYIGREREARTQYAAAAKLDLSESDRVNLARRLRVGHD